MKVQIAVTTVVGNRVVLTVTYPDVQSRDEALRKFIDTHLQVEEVQDFPRPLGAR